jgi:hypothetical protein
MRVPSTERATPAWTSQFSRYQQREKVVTYLEEAMKPNIGFFIFLRSANEAFPAWVVSISTNVATDFALSRVISWARVYVDLEPYLRP